VPRAERRAKIALEEVVAAATPTRQLHWRQQHADPNRAAEFHRLQKMTLLLPGPNAYTGAADVGCLWPASCGDGHLRRRLDRREG
jgi:hypothetical protein